LPAAACLTRAETVLIPVLALSISQALSELGYAGLVLLMIAETVFPPIPSEVVLPLAGYLVQKGDWFRRRGAVMVLAERCIPGVRSLIALPAGVLRMPRGKYVVLTLIGSTVWNAALITAGYVLGAQSERVSDAIGPLTLSARRPRILDGLPPRVRSQPASQRQTVRT
jgi:membrane protein DedA with SNARE-associated domain